MVLCRYTWYVCVCVSVRYNTRGTNNEKEVRVTWPYLRPQTHTHGGGVARPKCASVLTKHNASVHANGCTHTRNRSVA